MAHTNHATVAIYLKAETAQFILRCLCVTRILKRLYYKGTMNTQQTLWNKRRLSSCALTMNLRASIRYQYDIAVKLGYATKDHAFRVMHAENYLIRRLQRVYN